MAWKIPFVDDFPNYKPPFRISFGDFPASHVWSSTVADLKKRRAVASLEALLPAIQVTTAVHSPNDLCANEGAMVKLHGFYMD